MRDVDGAAEAVASRVVETSEPGDDDRTTEPNGVPGLAYAPQGLATATDAPAGSAFDVQVKVPGSASFTDWRTGVTSLQGTFAPSDPQWAGPGTYSFRSRLRQVSTGAASGYSPQGSISLS